jgi:hypothetical protein
MKSNGKKSVLKKLRTGIRLNTPPPKLEVAKKTYTRKSKHKKKIEYSD